MAGVHDALPSGRYVHQDVRDPAAAKGIVDAIAATEGEATLPRNLTKQ